MDDLLTEFLTETTESLAVLDVELVKFEKDSNDKEILSNIFRLVHTIKGTSGFLGLPRLEKVAHRGEDVLGKFRDGELEVTPEAVTLILTCIDRIREILDELEQSGKEPEGDDSELIAALEAMAEGKPAPAAPDGGAPAEAEAAAADDGQGAEGGPVVSDEGFPIAAELLAEVEDALAEGKKAAGDQVTVVDVVVEEAAAAAESEKTDPAEKPVPAPVEAKPPAGGQAAKAAQPAKKADPKAHKDSVANSSIRVNVEVLENLMTLVSELVLTRNQLLQMVRGHDDSEFVVPLQRLSHITSDLQEGVMKSRMQPIGNAWAKLPRIVRDLAVEMDKKIDLQMVGAETELDRQVLELIKDPLTHMVRNSGDHGLETPEERRAAGKPETGVIKLQAFHEGGHIIIQISDDGRGLNMERIRAKIVEKGLATEAELEAMEDVQVQQFILKPGFSTAEKITNVSGRGVGMDVVKTNIERIGGTIEFKSVEGKGSTFTIKIPLTLAIVSALVVECGGERFAIPQISVLELVRASAKAEHTIELINESPVLRLRNRLLPLVGLRGLLDLGDGGAAAALPYGGDGTNGQTSDPALLASANGDEPAPDQPAADALDTASPEGDADGVETAADPACLPAATNGSENDLGAGLDDEAFIVVSQVGSYTFGIIVDRVFDTEEIVVKPVAPILRDIPFYSGNTILGDGSVIMILDPNGIAASTGQGAGGAPRKSDTAEAASGGVGSEGELTSMLIFRAGADELKAVPLALIARLEEIDMKTVERSHGQMVVQYRGSLMPLIPCDPAHEWKTEDRQPILVFTDRERSMGLVVDEIVDIIEEHLKVEISADSPGLIGSAVLAGKATGIVDAGYYLTKAFSDWFGSTQAMPGGENGADRDGKRLLLVDDSPFFRNLLSPILSVAGYEVTTAENADEALKLREAGASFDVIISDIEMPGMNGFEFAEAVRGDPRWARIPMVALSSHATEGDVARGRQVGFNDYVAKFDRDNLVATLAQPALWADE